MGSHLLTLPFVNSMLMEALLVVFDFPGQIQFHLDFNISYFIPGFIPSIPRQSFHAVQLFSHVNGNSPSLSSLPFLRNEPVSIATPQSREASRNISTIPTRSEPCNCTHFFNSSCLFPMLHALVYRHFRKASQHVELLERVWGISP